MGDIAFIMDCIDELTGKWGKMIRIMFLNDIKNRIDERIKALEEN